MYLFRSLALATPLVLLASRPVVVDACELLTPAEAGAVLAETILPGQHPTAKITTICLFSPSPKASIQDKKALVSILTITSFNSGKIPVKGVTKTAVNGVGDEAVFIVTSGFGGGLNVRKGASAFQIRVNGGRLTIPQEEDLEKALAIVVLKRL